MFTVLCRHPQSACQSTAVFLYVIGKSNIMETWKYSIVFGIKGKHKFKPTNKRANSYKLKLSKIWNC